MLHFNIRNLENEKVQVSSPSEWNELSLRQFMEIEGAEDLNVLESFCTLTGMDLTIPEQSQDKELEANIWRVVAFITKPPEWSKLAMPSIIEIGGKTYPVPLSYKKITVGQNIMIGQAIKETKDILLKIPDVLAVIFQPLIKGPDFKSKELPDIREQLLECNALHCYAIAVFFYLNTKVLTKYGPNGLPVSQQLMTPKAKLQPKWLKQIDWTGSVAYAN